MCVQNRIVVGWEAGVCFPLENVRAKVLVLENCVLFLGVKATSYVQGCKVYFRGVFRKSGGAWVFCFTNSADFNVVEVYWAGAASLPPTTVNLERPLAPRAVPGESPVRRPVSNTWLSERAVSVTAEVSALRGGNNKCS